MCNAGMNEWVACLPQFDHIRLVSYFHSRRCMCVCAPYVHQYDCVRFYSVHSVQLICAAWTSAWATVCYFQYNVNHDEHWADYSLTHCIRNEIEVVLLLDPTVDHRPSCACWFACVLNSALNNFNTSSTWLNRIGNHPLVHSMCNICQMSKRHATDLFNNLIRRTWPFWSIVTIHHTMRV